jgi:hypothetical protein
LLKYKLLLSILIRKINKLQMPFVHCAVANAISISSFLDPFVPSAFYFKPMLQTWLPSLDSRHNDESQITRNNFIARLFAFYQARMCESALGRVYGRAGCHYSLSVRAINYSRCDVYLFVILPLRRAHNENSSATLCLL